MHHADVEQIFIVTARPITDLELIDKCRGRTTEKTYVNQFLPLRLDSEDLEVILPRWREAVINIDTGEFAIGDGVNKFSDLPKIKLPD